MDEYDVEEIRKKLFEYKQNCAKIFRIEALIRRDGLAVSINFSQSISDMKEKINEVESWLLLLSEDEAYVIRRRFFDGFTWSRIEAEYAEHWKDFSKTSRTLMRYQKNALMKIHQFMCCDTFVCEQNECLDHYKTDKKNL